MNKITKTNDGKVYYDRRAMPAQGDLAYEKINTPKADYSTNSDYEPSYAFAITLLTLVGSLGVFLVMLTQ